MSRKCNASVMKMEPKPEETYHNRGLQTIYYDTSSVPFDKTKLSFLGPFFFNIIEVTASKRQKRQSCRRGFLTSLGVQLAKENMNESASHYRISRYTNVRAAHELMLNKNISKPVCPYAADPSGTTKRDKTGWFPSKGR